MFDPAFKVLEANPKACRSSCLAVDSKSHVLGDFVSVGPVVGEVEPHPGIGCRPVHVDTGDDLVLRDGVVKPGVIADQGTAGPASTDPSLVPSGLTSPGPRCP